MKSYDDILEKLSKSTFRSKFHLKKKDLEYVSNKGMETIKSHCFLFVKERLAPKKQVNDGKQTPMRNHPVFIAQHATATCCRGCLKKWHNIDENHNLEDDEIDFVVNLIMKWLEKEVQNASGNN